MDPLSATDPGFKESGSESRANTKVPPRFGSSAAKVEFVAPMFASVAAASNADAAATVKTDLPVRKSSISDIGFNFSLPFIVSCRAPQSSLRVVFRRPSHLDGSRKHIAKITCPLSTGAKVRSTNPEFRTGGRPKFRNRGSVLESVRNGIPCCPRPDHPPLIELPDGACRRGAWRLPRASRAVYKT